MSEKISLPYSVVDREALACRRAVIFALELSITETKVEGDSTMFIDFINSKGCCTVGYGHIIEDSRLAMLDFGFIYFSHAKRSGNSIAHHLVKKVKGLLKPLFWLEEVPADITPFINRDKFLI